MLVRVFCVNMGAKKQRGIATLFGKADEGNRTLVCSLGSCRSTIELHPQMIFKSTSIIAKIVERVKASSKKEQRWAVGLQYICYNSKIKMRKS